MTIARARARKRVHEGGTRSSLTVTKHRVIKGLSLASLSLRAARIRTASSEERKGDMLYFFNQAGAVHDPDAEGIELANISAARVQAVKFAAQMLLDRPDIAWLGDEYRVEVTDENQLILFTFIALGVDAAAAKGMA